MKKIVLFLSLFTISFGFSQSLPINFEADITTSNLVDFDGGTGTVIANPSESGINTSSNVGRIVRDGGAIYGGSKILLTENLDFSVLTKISMKVYTTAPVGTTIKFKLEGEGASVDVDANTTVSGTWETLDWIFVGTPNDLNEIVFMFDFGNLGDGTENSTFYFDDIEQIEGPTAPIPASLPLNFEAGVTNTDFLSYSGATVSIIANPQINEVNTSATVCQIVRDGGNFWAGSKIFLSNDIDFSTMWHISMKVYTTAPIGTRIKLELEKPSGTANLDYLTTVSGEWETISWNFDGQPSDFNKLTFLFDFGNVGDGSDTSTFLFDDVQQFAGPAIPDAVPASLPIDFEASAVTSDFINVSGGFASVIPNPEMNSDNPSATVGQFIRSGGAGWAQSKLALTDFITNMSTNGTISMKIYTEAPVGTLLKFKLESNVAGFAKEQDAYTTVSGGWATYIWDLSNGDAPIYNVITLMLGYATPNDASTAATFLFDDIKQVSSTLSNTIDEKLNMKGVSSYPNPAKESLTINSEKKLMTKIVLFDILGNQITVLNPNSRKTTIDVSNFTSGIYIAKIATLSGTGSIKLIVE